MKLALLIRVNNFMLEATCDLVLDMMKEIRLLLSTKMLKMLTKNDVLLCNRCLDTILALLRLSMAHLIGFTNDLFELSE